MDTAARPAVAETAVAVEVVASTYRLSVRRDRPLAVLFDPNSRRWLQLALLSAVNAADGLDATYAVDPVTIDDSGDGAPPGGALRLRVARRSGRWRSSEVVLDCFDDRLELCARVDGSGSLADVHLLGGYQPGFDSWGSGFAWTGSDARTLFSSAPTDPNMVLRSAAAPAVIGVVGGGPPGRGNWFFTPGPFAFALSREIELDAPDFEGDWLGLSLVVPIDAATFTNLAYEPAERGFDLRLDYEGQTSVSGAWTSPVVVVRPGLRRPYQAIERHVADVRAASSSEAAPSEGRAASPSPRWWLEPIFCGWGAQCHLALARGGRPQAYATQPAYDGFLAALAEKGIVPGTVVIDDKWQAGYGTGEPDAAKWPDLRAWISARHEAGQRVLLWWKAWDPEGLTPEMCVRTGTGTPVAVDPASAAYRTALEETVGRLLGRDGLDADGFKIDFTATTPSGPGLGHAGGWGISLLHELLAAIYRTARGAKRDALVVTHAPNPLFGDVTDMIRLNDLLRLDDTDQPIDVVDQMTYRAKVVRAALPDTPIDTDDWGVPSREAWRRYAVAKPALGVPALYYATHLDLTGEALVDADYDLIRSTWEEWRSRIGTAAMAADAGRDSGLVGDVPTR